MRFKGMALAALMVACGAGQAMAATAFSDGFTSGLGPTESTFGIFSVANGTVGTQGGYDNNQVGAYAFSANLLGYSNPTLTYNYSVNTESCCDLLQVYATTSPAGLMNATQIAQYSGVQNGTASLDLSSFVSMNTTVLFRFTSDGSVTGTGVSLSAISVTGNAGAGAPGPVAGAGLPFVAAAGLAWLRRRRRAAKGLPTRVA